MYTFVIALIIFIAILLVIVVLAQNSKGGGLTSQFGGSGASNIMGVKKTGDLLEKLTWSFIVIIMVLALATNFISPTSGSRQNNEILDKANEQGTSAPANQSPEIVIPADSAQ
jgi:preprotein translocase subunit SecG